MILWDAKEQLSEILEINIRRAALELGTHQVCVQYHSLYWNTYSQIQDQVSWSPYHHICNSFLEVEKPPAVTILLNEESLLSFHEQILRKQNLQQGQILYKRPKHKATEESWQKHREDMETTLRQKSQRWEWDVARRSQVQADKLQRIQKRFTKWKEWECAQLNKIKRRMREEEELFQHQRAEILKERLLHLSVDEKILLMLALLAISSPIWLMAVLIYSIHRKIRARAEWT